MSNINTKEKIFNVAIDLFSKKGYNKVSIREIAEKVGIKESSIYYHYSKKEDILDNILDYFIERINRIEITEEQMNELLKQDPMALYHFGSESFKSQYNSLEMIKILRLIFIELYHNIKIRNFFLEELINDPLNFWTLIFQSFIDKNIIKEDSNPRKLAQSYYNYSVFKMFESTVLNYPEYLHEINLDPIFDNIEDHFNFILDAVSIKNKDNHNHKNKPNSNNNSNKQDFNNKNKHNKNNYNENNKNNFDKNKHNKNNLNKNNHNKNNFNKKVISDKNNVDNQNLNNKKDYNKNNPNKQINKDKKYLR